MIQMVFNITDTALKKKKNITLFAKKEEEVSWRGFTFGFGCRSSLVFIKDRQNHKNYMQQLETELLPCGYDWGGENWICQTDGAFIHTAQSIKK